jgi:hypothetical protein
MARIARDAVGAVGQRVLHRELDVVEAGRHQLLQPLRIGQHAGGDEVAVEPGRRGVAHDLGRSRRTAGSPPERCSCSTPISAASAKTRPQVSASSSAEARASSTGFEQ